MELQPRLDSTVRASGWDANRMFRTACIRQLADIDGTTPVDLPGASAAVPAGSGRGGGLVISSSLRDERVERLLLHALPDWLLVLSDVAVESLGLLGALGWTELERYRAMQLTHVASQPCSVPTALSGRRIDLAHAAAPDTLLTPALRLAAQGQGRKSTLASPDVTSTVRLLQLLPNVHLFGAVDCAGHVVSTAGVRILGRTAMVTSVATAPSWRGQGLATAMTKMALNAAADAGADQAFLDSTPDAERLYRRLGFHDLGTVLHCYQSTLIAA